MKNANVTEYLNRHQHSKKMIFVGHSISSYWHYDAVRFWYGNSFFFLLKKVVHLQWVEQLEPSIVCSNFASSFSVSLDRWIWMTNLLGKHNGLNRKMAAFMVKIRYINGIVSKQWNSIADAGAHFIQTIQKGTNQRADKCRNSIVNSSVMYC